MRRTLISVLCIICLSFSYAQQNSYKNKIVGNSLINIGLNEVNQIFTPHQSEHHLKSAALKCEMNITYVDFPAEAISAFEYAISIWEQHISSAVPINIRATWDKNKGTALASCNTYFYKNFDEAPVANVYYPIALVEKLTGEEANREKEADIFCSFNAKSAWYFGTDGNTPSNKYDFVSAVLHEIGHGLGFSGVLEKHGEMGTFDTPENLPSAYDYYIFNKNKQRISDNTIFDIPSEELLKQLTSNELYVKCSNGTENCNDAPIYAPSNWKNGVSIYHLKNSGNGPNELMSAYTYTGEAKHNPGENTLRVLRAIGWEDNNLKFEKIANTETVSEELPVKTKVISDFDIDNSSIVLFYSTDYFKTTKDSVLLIYDKETETFSGNLPTKSREGFIQYYYEAKTWDEQVVTHPKIAPVRMFEFRIGTDYQTPSMVHNKINMVSSQNPFVSMKATATDNIGIANVKVEYKINGTEQEAIELIRDKEMNDLFLAEFPFAEQLSKNDVIEYRICAKDCSERGNTKYLPQNGFYQVKVFENLSAVSSYETDFENFESDFTSTDFKISKPNGFSNRLLHSENPYTTSALEDEKYDLVAQLNYPIILEENGLLTFDEVVLVEPGEEGTIFTDKFFWDYVIVEASKDDGKTWNPLVDGYDSRVNDTWHSQFNTNLKSSVSSAAGHENMFWKQSINLTENEYFNAGDVVLIRFRLASDKSVNGWGWAIDNLQIQKSFGSDIEELAYENINVYPNPVADVLFVECPNTADKNSVEIVISNLSGKTVFKETRYDLDFYPKQQVDLSGFKPGIYMASITDSNLNTLTQKIIKL